jgi:hypothetical protein
MARWTELKKAQMRYKKALIDLAYREAEDNDMFLFNITAAQTDGEVEELKKQRAKALEIFGKTETLFAEDVDKANRLRPISGTAPASALVH